MEAIAKVNVARSSAEYADAVDEMLKALGDPVTRVLPKETDQKPLPGETGDPSFRTLADGVLLVSLRNFGQEPSFNFMVQQAFALAKEIPKAKAVIFDMRPPGRLTDNQQGVVANVFEFGSLASVLSSAPLVFPGERRRMHVGFMPQQGAASGVYESAFFISQRTKVLPDKSAKDVPVIFLVNQNSEIPAAAPALQAAGKAAIVAEGQIDEASAVTT